MSEAVNTKEFLSYLPEQTLDSLKSLLKKAKIRADFPEVGEGKIAVVLKEDSEDYPRRNLGRGRGKTKTAALLSAVVDAFFDDVNECGERIHSAFQEA